MFYTHCHKGLPGNYILNITGVGPKVALEGVAHLNKEETLDQCVQLIELGQSHVDLPLKLFLELEGTTSGRTHGGHQLGHSFLTS